MAGYGIQIKGSGRALMKKGGRSFPDLTGDGKVTRADVLKGRGVFAKGNMVRRNRGGGPDMGRRPRKRGNPAVMEPAPRRASPLKKARDRFRSGGVAMRGRGCEIK